MLVLLVHAISLIPPFAQLRTSRKDFVSARMGHVALVHPIVILILFGVKDVYLVHVTLLILPFVPITIYLEVTALLGTGIVVQVHPTAISTLFEVPDVDL